MSEENSLPERAELPVPHEARRIARRLQDAGFATWAVGGAVRDALAGLTPGDWDLTTAARPADVRAIFRRTVPIGIEHGTVGVLGRDGHLYEVTTFRLDVETFGRKARVAFADTLEEDLARRDFTINAVAWDPISREVRDPHGGMADLRSGVLRTVGDPAERFAEDRLRVLRALRFAGRFDLRVEPRTWQALRESASLLGGLSAERIREELMKILSGLARPSVSLRLYAESGVLAALYPELEACRGVRDGDADVWEHLLLTSDQVPTSRAVLRLAALLHDVGKPETRDDEGTFPRHAGVGAALAREVMRRLKSSGADTDRVTHLIAHHEEPPSAGTPAPELRRWIRRVGVEYVTDLQRLWIADWRARHGAEPAPHLVERWRTVRGEIARRPALSVGELAIGGAELRALGIPAGPLYGEILRDLLERVTDDPGLNTPERLTELVRERIG